MNVISLFAVNMRMKILLLVRYIELSTRKRERNNRLKKKITEYILSVWPMETSLKKLNMGLVKATLVHAEFVVR
jgi:hypothetical protein